MSILTHKNTNVRGRKVAKVLLAGALSVGTWCGLTVNAADGYTLNDGTLTFDVSSDDYPETSPYLYNQNLSSEVTAIVKKGTGSVSFGSRTNASYKGTITVEANGGFLMGITRAFGAPTEITVHNGGAMMFTETVKDEATMRNTHFKIEGNGPDGTGALMRPCVYAGTQINYFQTITLLDDATINTGSRWGIQDGTINMGNHTLSLRNDRHATGYDWNFVCFDLNNTVAIKDPGEIVVQSGILNIEGESSKLVDAKDSNGTISNMTITALGSSRVRIMRVSQGAVPCPLVTDGTPSMMTWERSSADRHGQCSYYDGSVTIGKNKLELLGYNSSSTTLGYVFTREVSGVGTLTHDMLGALYFTGSSTNTLGGFSQKSKGWTCLEDDVHLNVTGAVVTIGSDSVAAPSTLILSNQSSIVEIPTPNDDNRAKRAAYRIGYLSGNTKYCGLLKIYDGAVVSNDLTLGYQGLGACYQFGGTLRMLNGRSGTTEFIGSDGGSYGYLGLNDGAFIQNDWMYLGKNGVGIIVQRGGVSYFGKESSGNPVRMTMSGTSAYGCLAVLGGRSVWRNYPSMNFNNYTPTGVDLTSSFTVDGPTAQVDLSAQFVRSVVATNALHPVTALINVGHGGELKTKNIQVAQQYSSTVSPSWESIREYVSAATKTYLNFNGGVLVAAQNGNFFDNSGNDAAHQPTRATLYEGGLVFDTNGKNVTWQQPMLRPYGRGIKAITLPAEACAANALLGPSRCTIVSSQGGAGADALMDYDDTNRVVRGMIITSPGFGYEETPTVTVAKSDTTAMWSCTVETVNYDAENFAHGGFTKRGIGTLTISCTNNYGGATRCEGGVLAFTAANGIPSGSALEFAASAVASADKSTALLTAVDYAGSMVVRITEAETLDTATFGRVKTLATFTTALAKTPTLEMVATDGTPVDASRWQLLLLDNGKTLKFGVNSGTTLLLR